MLLPIIMIIFCIVGGGAAYFFMQKAEKDKYKEKGADNTSANGFINVKDICGNFLYTLDGLIICYLKLTPISIDLYSRTEKRNIVKTLTAEMSATQFPFKFIAVSRPIDISPLLAELHNLLTTSDSVQRELLKAELTEMTNFALGGEIVERQFYIMLWDRELDGMDKELTGRARLFQEIFSSSRIPCTLLNQQEITRLCNLVNNPGYTHIEDSKIEAAIPLLEGGIKLCP